MSRKTEFSPDWWGKTLIGLVFGLLLAYTLVALFAWFGPHGIHGIDKVQFNMWIITPIWLTVFSLVYLFPTQAAAFKYLGSANLVGLLLFWLLRSLT